MTFSRDSESFGRERNRCLDLWLRIRGWRGLPAPKLAPVSVREWISRVAMLETRVKVKIDEGPEMMISGDADQLEQLLINLLHNAADAVLECGSQASVGWSSQDSQLEVWVTDDGPGIQNTANVFVPFFYTQPGGTCV